MAEIKDNEYFALAPTKEIAGYLEQKVDQYYDYILTTGILALWRKVYRQYYVGYYNRGEITREGNAGQLQRFDVNHYRNFIQHMLVMTLDQRPAYQPRAVNSDYKSMQQCILADGLLDYYMRAKNLDEYEVQALEYGLIYGEGWAYNAWDYTAGEVYGGEMDEDNLEVVKTGDIDFNVFAPIDVIRDPSHKNVKDVKWVIFRKWVNKYDLAAKYTKWKEEIESQPVSSVSDIRDRIIDEQDFKKVYTEVIPYYIFVHDKTASMPNGRVVEYVNEEIVMFDGDLPSERAEFYSIMPSSRTDTPFGYSISFDLLPVQRGIDTLYSTIITNQSTFGVQNITSKKGNGITAESVAGNLNLLEYNFEKPEPLNLTHTPPEIFNMLSLLVRDMETLSAVSATVRGDPQANVKSGAAMALLASMSIKFNHGLQQSFVRFHEHLGNSIISMLKKFATVPRIAMIVGKAKKAALREFTSDDLHLIYRVFCDVGSAFSKTTPGKVQIADQLIERGLIKQPIEYINVIDTGRVDPLYEADQDEILLIREENEKMSNGEMVRAIFNDNHQLHIQEHRCVLASSESRAQEDVVNSVQSHMMEHIQLLQTTPPEMLILMGQQPLAPSVPPGEEGGVQMPLEEGAGQDAVTMPNNPMTGADFTPETGGL